MLDDLRMEIIVLRETNSELWAQIAEQKVGYRKHDKNSGSSHSRQQIEHLTKANAQLEHEVSVLCEQLKNFEIDRVKELADIQSNHYRVINEREMLVAAMKEAMAEKDRYFQEERKILNEKILQLEELRRADKLQLKEDLKRTQESHHKYLSKLNFELKAAQLARKMEMARLSEELDIVKHEKDALVRKLRRLARQGDVPRGDSLKKGQGETLRKPRKDNMSDMRDAHETKEFERSVKRQREENNPYPWSPKPVWIKEGNCWVKSESGVRRTQFVR
jgi:hypothetical protein